VTNGSLKNLNDLFLFLKKERKELKKSIRSIRSEIQLLSQSQNGQQQLDNSDFSKKYISRSKMMEDFNISSPTTPWSWENLGKLTPVKIGRSIFYLRSEVQDLIKKRPGK